MLNILNSKKMFEIQDTSCRILRQLQFAIFSYHVFLEGFSPFP